MGVINFLEKIFKKVSKKGKPRELTPQEREKYTRETQEYIEELRRQHPYYVKDYRSIITNRIIDGAEKATKTQKDPREVYFGLKRYFKRYWDRNLREDELGGRLPFDRELTSEEETAKRREEERVRSLVKCKKEEEKNERITNIWYKENEPHLIKLFSEHSKDFNGLSFGAKINRYEDANVTLLARKDGRFDLQVNYSSEGYESEPPRVFTNGKKGFSAEELFKGVNSGGHAVKILLPLPKQLGKDYFIEEIKKRTGIDASYEGIKGKKSLEQKVLPFIGVGSTILVLVSIISSSLRINGYATNSFVNLTSNWFGGIFFILGLVGIVFFFKKID